MPRQVGVSIVAFFPWFLLPGGHAWIRWVLDDLPVQLLPLRGLNHNKTEKYNVMSIEGPWNCGRLKDAWKRATGKAGKQYPSLIDIALFGSERLVKSRIRMMHVIHPMAPLIDAPWFPESLIELSPDMFSGHARNWNGLVPQGVVLDTYHWRRFKIGEAERQLHRFGGYDAVRMVHLKLMSSEEVRRFMEGCGQNVALLQKFLVHDKARRIPVVIEVQPTALYSLGRNLGDGLKSLVLRVHQIAP